MDEQELLKLARESEQTDLAVLLTAKEDAKRAVQDKASPANLAALERASKMLSDFLEKHKEQAAEDQVVTPPPYEESKSAMAVLRWLQESGYQKEKSQLYDDIKDGKLKSNRHGVFTKRLVKKYAALLPMAATGKSAAEAKLDLGYQKQEKEIARLNIQNEREQLKLDEEKGLYVLREKFDQELAARLIVLESGLRRLSQSKALEFIHLVGGKPQKADELERAMASAHADLLNTYATTKKFHVLILPAPQADQQDNQPDSDQ